MQKFLILVLSLSFIAASCNDPFSLTSGEKGVFKSEDAGESFKSVNQLSPTGSISNVSANNLSFDPKDSKTLYLAASSGIYKTTDGGKLWKFILTGIGVADTAINPYNSQIVYAAGISGSNGKIIKSMDGGSSWTDAYTEPSKSNAVLSLAVSQTNPAIIIAGLSTGEIIRSSDSGNTWQAVNDFQDRIIEIRFGPNSAVYALTYRSGLYKSADQGLTWAALTKSLTSNGLFSESSRPLTVSVFYDLALDQRQSGVIYLAAEEGLIRSVNDGTSWSAINLPVKNASLRVSSVAVSPTNSNNLFVSIGSTVFKTLNGGITWETKELRSEQAIRLIMIDSVSPNVVYLGLGEKK
ncbi:MAG TPA: hypothetical protein VGQ87_01935 [Patescibacteria group bacterium]|jgi:photosystem II stability/assembly factor-like uncharacterized protein|nr:hypothetical protein [Patescibacteria group bacterium]